MPSPFTANHIQQFVAAHRSEVVNIHIVPRREGMQALAIGLGLGSAGRPPEDAHLTGDCHGGAARGRAGSKKQEQKTPIEPSRVGRRRALLAADHRGMASEPLQLSLINRYAFMAPPPIDRVVRLSAPQHGLRAR